MTLSTNQFAQTNSQGTRDLPMFGNVFSFQVDAAQATDLVAGQAVKMATTAGGVPKVLSLAADTDAPVGFIIRNFKDASYSAGDYVEVAYQGTVLWMTAGALIARGAKLQTVNATVKVITNAGTNPVVGWALDAAAADGDLIRVYVLSPAYESAQVIADIAGLQAALDALGTGETQAITALNTVGAGTITAAGIAGGLTSRGGSQTAVFTDTTATATLIKAELANLTVGESFYYTYRNDTTFAATLVGGVGVTASIQTVVNPKSWVKYLMTYTALNTFTMVAVMSGPLDNTLTDFINAGAKVCTTQVDRAESTTLTNVTGCSVALKAAGKYIFKAHITGVATANGGAKAAIAGDGTLSATSFTCTGTNFDTTTTNAQSTTTTLGTAVGAATAAMTDMYLDGSIVVNAAGVLSLQIAQNASHVDTTSAYANSTLEVIRVA